MNDPTTIARRACHALAMVLLLLGIVLVVMNFTLILIGLLTGLVMSPEYSRLVLVCLLAWIGAFIVAGALRLIAAMWLDQRTNAG